MPKKSSKGEKKKEGEDGGQTEEARAQLLKEMLQQEERKADRGWQLPFRHSEDPKHWEELVVLRETSVRELEEQENVIRKLVRDLEEHERRSSQLWRGHRQRGDRLQALQDIQVKLLQEMRERHKQRHISNLSRERKQTVACFQQQKANLEGKFVALGEPQKEEAKGSSVTKETVETKMSSYGKKVETEVKEKKKKKNPAAKTRRVKKNQRTLTDEIDKMMQMVEKLKLRGSENHRGRLQEMRERVRLSKLRFKQIIVKVEEFLTRHKDELERQRQETRDLQGQLTRAQKASWKQLTDLTVQGENTTKKLKAVITKGERVLNVGELCCKRESQVLPFLSPEKHQQDSTGPETEASVKETFPELQQLTRRLNSAQLLRDALRTRRDDLSRENKQLKTELHEYVKGASISDRVLDRAPQTPVLTVNKAPTTTVRQNTETRRKTHTVRDRQTGRQTDRH